MAREVTEFVSSGVSQATFDAHTHPYRKITELGVDGQGTYGSPQRVAIVDDSEVNITDANKVAAVGITVDTQETGIP
jgi:hypothetical protein